MSKSSATGTSTSSLDFCCLGLGGLIMLMLMLVPVSIEPDAADSGDDMDVPFDYEADVSIALPVLEGTTQVLVDGGEWNDSSSLMKALEEVGSSFNAPVSYASTNKYPISDDVDLPSLIIVQLGAITVDYSVAGRRGQLQLTPGDPARSEEVGDSSVSAVYLQDNTSYMYEFSESAGSASHPPKESFEMRKHQAVVQLKTPGRPEPGECSLTLTFNAWGVWWYASDADDFLCVSSDSPDRSRGSVFFRVSSSVLPSGPARSVYCVTEAGDRFRCISVSVTVKAQLGMAEDPTTGTQVLGCEKLEVTCHKIAELQG